jgi:hypothetical protein
VEFLAMEEILDLKALIQEEDMILLIHLITKEEFSHLTISKVLMNLVIRFLNLKFQKDRSYQEEEIHLISNRLDSVGDLEEVLKEDLEETNSFD